MQNVSVSSGDGVIDGGPQNDTYQDLAGNTGFTTTGFEGLLAQTFRRSG
jgi:hypothetical protein